MLDSIVALWKTKRKAAIFHARVYHFLDEQEKGATSGRNSGKGKGKGKGTDITVIPSHFGLYFTHFSAGGLNQEQSRLEAGQNNGETSL